MRAVFFSVLVGAACATMPAEAQSVFSAPAAGFTYFNRPGATVQQHREDIEGCFDPVASMGPAVIPPGYDPVAANYGYYSQTYGPGGAAVGSLVIGVMQAQNDRMAQNRAIAGHYENCMVARGWRVVRVENRVGRRLRSLSLSELTRELAPMIGAQQPHGEVVRSFANDLAGPPPAGAEDQDRPVSLSLLGMPRHAIVSDDLRPRPSYDVDEADARRQAMELERMREERLEAAETRAASWLSRRVLTPVEDISSLETEASLIVVGFSGAGGAVQFAHEDEAGNVSALVVSGPAQKNGEDATATMVRLFAVPPGRWRLDTLQSVSLCMGAPAFEIARGEVVFAGVFSPGSAPDMTPAAGEAALSAAPEMAARLRPAEYVNGHVFNCGAAPWLFAYELPGQPFADGYRWGSRASSTSASATNQ